MTMLPELASERWFDRPAVAHIFALLDESGAGARVIGGAVRNALMGQPVTELDFATPLTPDEVLARAAREGLHAIPTGVDHGTVTVVVDHEPFEITTLREDIETDGRHAVVRFGHDWTADAKRRDFTINALSVDKNGVVHDPLGGYGDILTGTVRFIGAADRRVAEDRLRILRLFRLQAEYGRAPLAEADLGAAIRGRDGLRALSAERIGAEIKRLVVAQGAAEAVTLMQDSGILPIILGGIAYTSAFRRLVAFERAVDVTPALPLRLACLTSRVHEDVARVTERLRLANAERNRMLATIAAAVDAPSPGDGRALRRHLYAAGDEARAAIAFSFTTSRAEPGDPAWQDLYRTAGEETVPVFPLSGRDLRDLGYPEGPALGQLLKALEQWWIDQDFVPDDTALRRRLHQMAAAAQ